MPLINLSRHYIPGVLILVALAGIISVSAFPPLDNQLLTAINKNGMDLELRSEGRMIADEMLNQVTLEPDSLASRVDQESHDKDVKFRGANMQVNDGALDHIQILPGFRPFVFFTQSETTIALGDKNGKNIVVSYNSTANSPVVLIAPGIAVFEHVFFSAYSFSNDGGKTFTSGFVPPVPGGLFTFGDGVVAADRLGNFYYSGLGADAMLRGTVQVNKSTDGGRTFEDAVIVQQDDGSDKEWIAVGPDPINMDRDNVYVTWTSFQSRPSRAELRFGRSIDGGQTWTSKTVFAPTTDPNPTHPQNFLQSSTPVVDPDTGRLYIAFLQFSNSDQDFLRILISDDAGETFRFATFNIFGAPDPTLLPIVQAGDFEDCGTDGSFRLAIHQGMNIGGGRFGLPRYVRSARIFTNPALAARNGQVFLAWNNNNSPFFGDGSLGSSILFMRSYDGGNTWTTAMQVNPTASDDVQHVHPAIAISEDDKHGGAVHISYYTQHNDGSVDLDLASSDDNGDTFEAGAVVRVTSGRSNLAPTNIPIPTAGNPFRTTNYDRIVFPCYNLGEYNGLARSKHDVFAVWADGRKLVTEPVNALDPISGQTHAQQDVLLQNLKVK